MSPLWLAPKLQHCHSSYPPPQITLYLVEKTLGFYTSSIIPLGLKTTIFPLYIYLNDNSQVISRIIINQGSSQDLFPLYNFNLIILKLFQE